MGSVQNAIPPKRMTETLAGRAAALLLALLWLASMGMTDINAYSYFPTVAGMAVVLLLVLSALIRGARAVPLSWTAWGALAVGGYFLARCLCSFDVVSSWREAGLILCCGVFYVAGLYAAQSRSLKPAVAVLLVAVLLHMVYFLLMKRTDIPMEWAGRPSFGPGGANHRPVTLFVYKNMAGAFLMIGGAMLAAAALWACRGKRLLRLVLAVPGVAAVALSGCCGTRAVWLLAPVLLFLVWVLWVVVKLNTEENVGWVVILSSFLILGCIGFGFCTLLFDRELLAWIADIDTHSRYDIWHVCCLLIRQAPLWGYGADSVPWMLAPCHDSGINLVNFAHNEYIQAWFDYGAVGLAGMLLILGAHLARGGMVLFSASVPSTQHKLTALALLGLLGWSVAAFVDFYWHHISVAGMTAFCLGILASPFPYERRGRLHRIHVQGVAGKGILAMVSCAAIGACVWLATLFAPAWEQQWVFNRLSTPGRDDEGTQRLAILNSLLPHYPSHRLADTAYMLPCHAAWAEEEEMLQRVLRANPRQLYMIGALARLYTAQGRYEEAEKLYRRHFPADGLPITGAACWPYYYFLNLISWGHRCMLKGDMPGAYSRMRYALAIHQHAKLYKMNYRPWDAGYLSGDQQKAAGRYLNARKQDVKLMTALRMTPDDSWMQPLEPGGQPALYRRYGLPDAAEREKVADEFQRTWRIYGNNPKGKPKK